MDTLFTTVPRTDDHDLCPRRGANTAPPKKKCRLRRGREYRVESCRMPAAADAVGGAEGPVERLQFDGVMPLNNKWVFDGADAVSLEGRASFLFFEISEHADGERRGRAAV